MLAAPARGPARAPPLRLDDGTTLLVAAHERERYGQRASHVEWAADGSAVATWRNTRRGDAKLVVRRERCNFFDIIALHVSDPESKHGKKRSIAQAARGADVCAVWSGEAARDNRRG